MSKNKITWHPVNNLPKDAVFLFKDPDGLESTKLYLTPSGGLYKSYNWFGPFLRSPVTKFAVAEVTEDFVYAVARNKVYTVWSDGTHSYNQDQRGCKSASNDHPFLLPSELKALGTDEYPAMIQLIKQLRENRGFDLKTAKETAEFFVGKTERWSEADRGRAPKKEADPVDDLPF